MKLRLPLFAQILGWFFLNLALLAAVAWILIRSNFALGLDSALLAQGEARVQALAELVTVEIRERPRAEWNNVLRRYSEAYGVDVRFYEPNGQRLAGTDTPLPENVREKLTDPPAGGGPRNDRPPAPGERLPPRGPPVNRSSPKFLLRTDASPRYWLLTRTLLRYDDGTRIPSAVLIASDSIGFNGLLVEFRPWLMAAGGAALLSALIWFPFARAITRSVARMTHTTGQIAEGQFDVRVTTRRRDELGSLAASINTMAARLAGFVTGQKRFLGDVAHELCAPLSRIQMALGILEQRADSAEKQHLDDLREEVQHMSALVNELLSFSKASLKARDLPLTPTPLLPLAQRVLARETAPTDRIDLDIPEELHALADAELLARALANLVRNALRYAGHAGPITLTARAQDGHILLTVADHGPGVPAEILPQLGDPFFRPEASRSRETGGVGLGLSIVKSCVEACQGKVTFHNRPPTGFQADLQLQAAP